jgi:hypothetical protein
VPKPSGVTAAERVSVPEPGEPEAQAEPEEDTESPMSPGSPSAAAEAAEHEDAGEQDDNPPST